MPLPPSRRSWRTSVTHCSLFSDAAFHQACVDAHPDGDAARKRAAEVREHSSPYGRTCAVCGEQILDPDDYLGFGYLSGDTGLAASGFNYVHLHRSHISGGGISAQLFKRLKSFATLAHGRGTGSQLLLRNCGNTRGSVIRVLSALRARLEAIAAGKCDAKADSGRVASEFVACSRVRRGYETGTSARARAGTRVHAEHRRTV
jgi:hypothetical protein